MSNYFLRNRVITARMQRVTPQNSLHRQPYSLYCAVPANCINGIRRTRRIKPACARGKQGRDYRLIETNDCNNEKLHTYFPTAIAVKSDFISRSISLNGGLSNGRADTFGYRNKSFRFRDRSPEGISSKFLFNRYDSLIRRRMRLRSTAFFIALETITPNRSGRVSKFS